MMNHNLRFPVDEKTPSPPPFSSGPSKALQRPFNSDLFDFTVEGISDDFWKLRKLLAVRVPQMPHP